MSMAAIAIGTTAVSVAGGITASAMSADASKKAAGASSGSNKKLIEQQTADVAKYDQELQTALSTYNANLTGISAAVAAVDPTIKIPNYSLLGTPDIYKKDKKGNVILNKKTGLPVIKNRGQASAVLEGIKAANEITTNSLFQLENVLPGAENARKKAMEDIKVWESRLEDQYNKVQEAYPLLNQAGEIILSSEEKLKMSEERLKKAEEKILLSEGEFQKSGERLLRSEEVLNQSQRQYEAAGNILQQQLPLIQQARDVAGNLLLGELPDVTKRQITRAIAETGGAGFNPAAAGRTSGFQMPQGALSQNLAEAAEERQRFGLSAVSNLTGQTAQMSAGQANVAQGIQNVGMGFQSAAQGYQNIGQGYQNMGAGLENVGRGYQSAAQGYQNMGAGLGNLAQGYGAAGAASANLGEAARGMQATNMAWQNLSQGFLQDVPQMMGIALTGRGQDIDKRRIEIEAQLRQQEMLANIAASQFNATTGVAGNIFDARTGLAQNIYQGQQQNIQNSLAAAQGNAQMISSIGQGIGQLGSAGMSAYNQYATAAAGASTTPMDSGFYRGQIGAANAYGVAPSQVRQYGSQGWSLR
jgi:hypothetical protein